LVQDNDRAVTDRQRQGGTRIVVGNRGHVLGDTIAGAHAGELIPPWVMALKQRASLRGMTDLIVPYPTLSEISKRAASAYYAPALFSRGTRMLVSALSWF
jgi:pyruvate/2-oxoglutarate dehydrogenase complex dihydrolipoamide dehydrogenase (E3) component